MAAFFQILASMIPWVEMAKNAPTIIAAARDLIDRAPRSPVAGRPVDTRNMGADEALGLLREETMLLRTAVTELQADSRRQAEVIARLAEQADGLAAALAVTRKRLKAAFWIAGAGVVLSAACLVMLFLR